VLNDVDDEDKGSEAVVKFVFFGVGWGGGREKTRHHITDQLSPKKLAIGAAFSDGNGGNSGHVRVFTWSGSAWVQKGSDIDGEAAGDFSGWSISLSDDGNTLAIGAKNNDGNGGNSGHVRVFTWNGSAWVHKGADIDGEAAGDFSGKSVSLSDDGNTLAIGAHWNDGNGSDSGHVRVFSWVEIPSV
jgi:hypothetical protein